MPPLTPPPQSRILNKVPRGGAVVARWAHNPKVGGSNPSPAIEGRLNKPPFLFELQTLVFIKIVSKIGGKISDRGQISSRTHFRRAQRPFGDHPNRDRCNAHRWSSFAYVRAARQPIPGRSLCADICSSPGGRHEIRPHGAFV